MSRMAKYYGYKKSNWNAAINDIEGDITIAKDTPTGGFHLYVRLCENPAQNNNIVNTIFTVKNVELSFHMECTPSQGNFDSITGYIMYVPQGMTIDGNLPYNHPEYVMAMKFFGSPELSGSEGGRSPAIIKTRLSRKLNTGDKLVAIFVGKHYINNQNNDVIGVKGICRWFTKAN